MRGRYDNPSEASSRFSAPVLNSRASSTTAVITPLEDFRTSRYIKPDVLSEELPGEGSPPFGDLTARAPTSEKVLRGATYSYDPEANGPYFSIPLKKTESKAPLTRRGTTKELIGRYESLSTNSSSSGGSSLEKIKSRTSLTTTTRGPHENAGEKKSKGRSPIRQSFRSLLSVFSKKAKTTREPSLYVSDLLSPPEESEAASYHATNSALSPPPVPTKAPIPPLLPIRSDLGSLHSPASGRELPICMTPLPLYTGTLLYLCKPISPDSLPVWINCDAALHRSHIVLTWFSNLGNPSTSLVQLSRCTDVRSLALGDLDAAEGSMLPEDPRFREPKVFELLFEGKAREKFAAASVKDRAGWVSATWDAILQASAERTPSIRSPLAGPQLAVLMPDPTPTAVQSPAATSIQKGSVLSSEDGAPSVLHTATPTPSPLVEPVKIQLYDPPIQRETPPPLTPDKSTYSRLPTPGRQSPSVRNLDHMSIVQQRLALLERTISTNSPSPSSTRSTRSRQIVSPPVSPVNDVPRQSILLRHGTISSIGQDSIVDSYGSSRVQSPMPPESGPLPFIPSGNSLAIEHSSFIARLSKLNVPQIPDRPDLFSPASQYSDAAKPTSPPPALSVNTDVPATRPPARSPATPTRLLAAYRQLPSLPEAITAPLRTRSPPPLAASPMLKAAVDAPPVILADPPAQRSLVSSPPAPQPQVTVLPDPEQHARLSKIRSQITKIQDEMHRLPETLGAVVADLAPTVVPAPPPKDEEEQKLLQGIDETVKRIEEQGEVNAQGLAGIHAKVDVVMALRQADVAAGAVPALPQEMVSAIMAKLEELGVQMQSDLPALSQKLEELATQPKTEQAPQDGPSSIPTASAPPPPAVSPEEIAKLHERLEEILSTVQASQLPSPAEPVQSRDEGAATETADAAPAPHPMLEELLALVKAEKEQRETQIAAQADSARYLNELNSWLETFVKHGTSQIEGVAAGMQHLCNELGPIDAIGEDGHNGGLLSEVRQMLAESKGRGDNVAALQMSVESLIAAVHEGVQATDARSQYPADTMVALIERQRQDQQHMLKTLATELSNDIRGERLRFVEAMKEATTINVQIHVEEFKKELTREVLSMTQEVTRLQRERQALEQQIADLFAFYAKQKQANELKGPKKKGRALPESGLALNAAAGRRPLPSPGQPGAMPGGM